MDVPWVLHQGLHQPRQVLSLQAFRGDLLPQLRQLRLDAWVPGGTHGGSGREKPWKIAMEMIFQKQYPTHIGWLWLIIATHKSG